MQFVHNTPKVQAQAIVSLPLISLIVSCFLHLSLSLAYSDLFCFFLFCFMHCELLTAFCIASRRKSLVWLLLCFIYLISFCKDFRKKEIFSIFVRRFVPLLSFVVFGLHPFNDDKCTCECDHYICCIFACVNRNKTERIFFSWRGSARYGFIRR